MKNYKIKISIIGTDRNFFNEKHSSEHILQSELNAVRINERIRDAVAKEFKENGNDKRTRK